MFEIEVVTTKKKLTKSILDQLPRCSFEEAMSVAYCTTLITEVYWVQEGGKIRCYLIHFSDGWRVYYDLDHVLTSCSAEYKAAHENFLRLTANNQIII